MFCGSCKAYTLKENCPKCGQKTILPKPPKYSPQDKYGKYRRICLEEERKNKGLL
jgi:H/ACA ribonucleoprotein complex subunit 3